LENQIEYQLNAISTDYFFLANHKKLGIDPKTATEIKYLTETSGREGIDKKENILQNVVIIKIYLDNNEGPLLLEAHFVFDYKIQGIKIDILDKRINLPDALILTFRSISYSTSRGLLIGKLSNTYLSNFILPLIDIKNLNKPIAAQHKKENS